MKGRKIVCQYCKKEGNSLFAYKVSKNDKNLYYCSEGEYEGYLLQDRARIEIYEFVASELFGYPKNQMVSTYLSRQIKLLKDKGYTYLQILNCIKEKRSTIAYYFENKSDLDTEQRKLQYMMAIIKNTINDTVKNKEIKIEEPKISDIELEVIDMDMKTTPRKRDNNNILDFI